MPPRDDSDYAQRRQQIIDGALSVFARKGFEKATNKDIASAADIGSPGLIYHYFKDKADLFRQVIEQHAPALLLMSHPETFFHKPPREALPLIARTFLQILDNHEAIAILRLMIGEVTRRPDIATMVNAIGPGHVLPTLSRYMAHQMEAGRLRRIDPAVAARCFVGPLLAYIITRELFPQPDSAALPSEMMVEQAVDLFLRGMEPEPD